MGRGDSSILFNPHPLKKAKSEEKKALETKPGDPLLGIEKEELLYPVVWEKVEEIHGIRRSATLGGINNKRSFCQELIKSGKGEKLAREVAQFYFAWESAALLSGLYQTLLESKGINFRKDILRVWGSLFSAHGDEVRKVIIENNLSLDLDQKNNLLQSLPAPHRLVISGGYSIRKDPLQGKWRLEKIELDQ